jgi:hypothetical protein
MQADFSLELGAHDPVLSVPWAAPEGEPRYYDLRRHPELLFCVEEAARNPELGEFLSRLNAERSLLQSAKCDLWFTRELGEEEQEFGAEGKFGGYIDLFFCDPHARSSLPAHESFGRQLAELLARAPELASAMEIILRRAYFLPESAPPGRDPAFGEGLRSGGEEGFYFTLYVFGYGDEEQEARQRWTVSLKLVQNALLQLAGRHS